MDLNFAGIYQSVVHPLKYGLGEIGVSFWFFLPPEDLRRQKTVVLQENIFAHLKAARLKPGDDIVLADGRGRAFAARLLSFEARKQSADAAILHELLQNSEPPLSITLFLGITKGEKMDQVVRQTVELGVKKIVPVFTERTIVRLDKKKKKVRTRRWQNIAFAAAAQSRRSFVPGISEPLYFEEMLDLFAGEKLEPVIVPWEEEKETGLMHLIAKMKPPPRAASIFTGPEGGIAPGEMDKLKKYRNIYPVTLGPRILRAETAPLAVMAVLMHLWGDLG
ncbi:MAG: 16S rRNA (uracil(1498)-N(3))-methyltransferase [Firmicutes bacterium]|nr:16S rRNA (uracil(1498)-N(3))-methyltransferase [Bacillota bacterium]